ncbi:MAG: hypothetical protein OXE73_13830 [Gammaproteobacteria bacterium]|nr:hypothetical protein [Gammaproteobacteria bacterium]
MNKSTKTEAEWAAVAQRLQLDALSGALRTLESQVDVLESESARQCDQLSRLEAMIEQIHADADSERPRAEGRTSADVAAHDPPSVQETRVDRQPTDPSGDLVLPDVGGNWESYLRNVERYIADHGIEVTGDPLSQLVPPHLAAEIRRRFAAEFRPAPWDRWDLRMVALAVLVGAMTDYLLVATPGGSFKGQPQRGSPLTAWMKEQSKKLAPMKGSDDLERNAFQQWIAELTTAAEKWAKVPYDVIIPKVGLTPNVHRLAALGHDPLFGLVFGVGDILSGTCRFIDKSGAWRVIKVPGHGGTSNVLEAMVKVVIHGFSDVFTPQGLPPPFLAPFQLVSSKSGFTLREGGDPVPVKDVARYMYGNGYDLRHFMTMKISPAIAELILWAYHGIRACATDSESSEVETSERLKREQMQALTHGALASANILKTALYGWNPMAINLAQFVTLAKRMLSLMKLAAERDGLLHQRLEDGWKALLAERLIVG